MNILMMTNTYLPHIGGVARSIESCACWLRKQGHRVLVVAPTFEGQDEHEPDVLRIPAIQHFNGTDFSVPLPVTSKLHRAVRHFEPDIVHSHHPFLLGDTALRIGAEFDSPVVFTHHTLYEHFTQYVPLDSPSMKRFAVDLATGYSDLCDAVIAPSQTVREILQKRGVHSPIEVIPTGVETEHFAGADGKRFRREYHLPEDAIVVGHVGRLASEKNLAFLSNALIQHAARNPRVRVLIVGDGEESPRIRESFKRAGVLDRLCATGPLEGEALAAAYRAMTVFAFASKVETQGLVLVEAMAAGVPVVGLDGPGVRDVIRDGQNGRLVSTEETSIFNAALAWTTRPGQCARLSAGAQETASNYSQAVTGDHLIDLYRHLDRKRRPSDFGTSSKWAMARRRLDEERRLATHRAHAIGDAWRGQGLAP